jgi:cyclopropane fatty-acyl-phospholipid synthase-like methyltransferase
VVAVFINWKNFDMNEVVNAKIEKYYDDSTFFYRYFWMKKKNLSMHYGFWDKNTKNIDDAFINENRYVADTLGIKKGDKVLDAGCGFGGTAIWIAENYGAEVTGVTITKKHIPIAKKFAKERSVSDLVKYELKDFCDTDLPSGSFDKIYGIESICYAVDKYDFLKEAFRLLKKGGKLIVCDGFLVKDELDESGKRYYDELCVGWALPNLSSYKKFETDLKKLGFSKIKSQIATEKVIKSSEEMFNSSKFIHPLVVLLEKLHLTSKTNVLAEVACQAQYHIFKDKIAVYGIFTAEK